MVNPIDFIPKIEGFSPMPMGAMVAFMKFQTAWMMYTGGYNWQFGKREVDSMTNEEFNARKKDYTIVINEQRALFKDFVTSMYAELEIMENNKVQEKLIDEMLKLEKEKIRVMPELLAQIPPAFFQGLSDVFNKAENTQPKSPVPPPTNAPGTDKRTPKTSEPTPTPKSDPKPTNPGSDRRAPPPPPQPSREQLESISKSAIDRTNARLEFINGRIIAGSKTNSSGNTVMNRVDLDRLRNEQSQLVKQLYQQRQNHKTNFGYWY